MRLVIDTIESGVREAEAPNLWRRPLVGFASAADPRFEKLATREGVPHARPWDLLPRARSVGALHADGTIDRRLCWDRCQEVAAGFLDVGVAQVCGKCATGRCAPASGVASSESSLETGEVR